MYQLVFIIYIFIGDCGFQWWDIWWLWSKPSICIRFNQTDRCDNCRRLHFYLGKTTQTVETDRWSLYYVRSSRIFLLCLCGYVLFSITFSVLAITQSPFLCANYYESIGYAPLLVRMVQLLGSNSTLLSAFINTASSSSGSTSSGSSSINAGSNQMVAISCCYSDAI